MRPDYEFLRPNLVNLAKPSAGIRGTVDLIFGEFVTAHAAVQHLLNLGRHLVRAQHYRDLRISACDDWSRAMA